MNAGVRVLVVDDEHDFRRSMSMLLSLAGFRVHEATDGHDALRIVDGAKPCEPFDVILLDYRMPGLNGGEVLGELRARDVRACVVLISAIGDLHAVAARHRFHAALPKPCDPEEVVATIRRCLPPRGH